MLHVVATPIGNLGDLTPRAQEALKGASLIACEDTRRTWQLLSHFGIPRPEMISYRQGNEDRVSRTVIDAVNAGREVVLVSDGGGYPAISDPGYRLVRLCAQENVPFDVLPGASAVNVALVLSGLPTSSFTFKGFPPRGPGALRNWFTAEKDLPHTLIGFESPFRIGPTLQAAYEVLGDREAAVCIELTKRFCDRRREPEVREERLIDKTIEKTMRWNFNTEAQRHRGTERSKKLEIQIEHAS